MFRFIRHYQIYMHDFSSKINDTPTWFVPWLHIDRLGVILMRMLIFLLILIPNMILIVLLTRQRQSDFRKKRRSGNTNSEASVPIPADTSLSQQATNILLMSSALLYLVTRSPKIFDLCAMALPYGLDFTYVEDWTLRNLMEPVIIVIAYMGYSLNVFVYLLSERQYRRRFTDFVVRPVFRVCCPAILPHRSQEVRTDFMEMTVPMSKDTEPL